MILFIVHFFTNTPFFASHKHTRKERLVNPGPRGGIEMSDQILKQFYENNKKRMLFRTSNISKIDGPVSFFAI